MDRSVSGLTGSTPPLERGADGGAELRRLADQLQGVFIQQLFQAMRDTVPESGSAFGRAGSEMFGGIMDEHLAEVASAKLERGLGEALYRQLARHAQDGGSDDRMGPGAVGGAGEELT